MPVTYVWLLCGYSSTTDTRTAKSNHKNFMHLVGLFTYCKMMHGAYNVEKYGIICVYTLKLH